MKLVITLILISCFSFSFSSFAQKNLNFKIYQNTDLFQLLCHIPSPRENVLQDKINFSRISLAVDFQSKKGSIHEFELQIPEFSKPLEKLDFPQKFGIWKGDAYKQVGTSFACRYELGKFLGDHSKPVNLLLSTGMHPYYVKLEYTPMSSSSYYYSVTHYGFALNVVPRLYFKLNQHFSLDLNSPIRIYNFRGSKYRQDNPILPLRQQRSSDLKHLFFEPVYTIRLGLRYTPNE